MKKTLLIMLVWGCCCSLLTGTAAARNPRSVFQGNPHDKFGSNSLAYSFFPLINNGFGIEYDRLLTPKTGRHWLKIAPTYYTTLSDATLRKTDIKRLRGFSVGAYHRYNYYEIEDVGFQLFLMWGLNYEQNRLLAHDLTTTSIRKIGFDLMLGFRQIIAKPLYFDFVLGYGNRFLLDKSYGYDGPALNPLPDGSLPEVTGKAYDANMFDYGYGGPVLSLNLTLGFIF